MEGGGWREVGGWRWGGWREVGRREVGWREVGQWEGEATQATLELPVHSVAAPTDAAPTDAARPTGGAQVTLELQLDNERNRLARFELTLNMAGLCIGTRAMLGRVRVRVRRYERGAL